MPAEINMRDKGDDHAGVGSYAWLAITLGLCFIIGLGDVASLVPFFDGVQVQLLYAHLFLSVFACRAALPLWCYILFSPLYDFVYGDFIGASGIAFVVFFMASVKLKEMGGPRNFFVLWCLFSLVFVAFEVVRNLLLGSFFAAHWGGNEILMYMALNIIVFPFAYGLLFPLKSKEK